MNSIIATERQQAARLAGALAHELNNPLQGLLSQITLVSAAAAGNESLLQRLDLLEIGVQRLSTAVKNFAALYENLPRNPDHASLKYLVQEMDKRLREKGYLTAGMEQAGDAAVLCMCDETARLLPEAIQLSPARGQLLHWQIFSDSMESTVRLSWRSNHDQARWKILEESDGLSGFPVLLEELVRLAGGRCEIQWLDDHWIGMAAILKHV